MLFKGLQLKNAAPSEGVYFSNYVVSGTCEALTISIAEHDV